MPRRLLIPLFAVLLAMVLPGAAEGKDLRKRVGLGFETTFGSVSCLSVKVGLPSSKPSANVQIQGLVGFAVLKNTDDKFFAGGRVLLPVLAEDNLNVYAGFGGGFARFDDATQAARIQAVLGTEFFLFGLENLGFTAEIGLNFDVGPTVLDLQTAGGTAASVGAHFYF
jgi:hypothetical protein